MAPSTFFTDNIGRDTLHLSPIDAAQTKKLSTRTVYDLADRILQTVTRAPAMPYTLANGVDPDTTSVVAETTTVTNTYDNEGRLTLALVRTSPLFDGYLIPGVSDSRTYDRAGRLLTRSLGSGPTGFTYDAAGNAVTQTYRNGGVVTAQFDALNRLTRRIVARRTYGRTDCLGHAFGPLYYSLSICSMKFPMYSTMAGDTLEIPADTSLFAFDSAGNMVQADNRDAHIRRHYAINGLLTADSLWMRDYASNAFTKVYGLRYGYDRDGRRTWMKLPATLSQGQDSMAYAYSPKNGALIRVRDGANRRDSLTYTPAGRLDSLFMFAAGASTPGLKESHQYDVDGRLTARERRTGANAGLQSDQLSYDAGGSVTHASTSSAATSQGALAFDLAYDGLGAVVASQVTNSMGVWDVEEYRTDGLGNVGYQHVRHASGNSTPPQTSTYGPNHLLKYRIGWLPDQCPTSWLYMDTLYQTADAAGNVIRAGDQHRDCDGNATSQTATNSYYSADNRLVVAQRFVWAPGQQPGGTLTGSWEEYRYDALGRRIMIRARRDHPTLCNQNATTTCVGFVERVVWDGNQVLYEQRTSGLDGITGGAPNYGTVGYVHALGIDQPVMLMDGRVIHYNWRGLGEASSWADGSPADVELGASTRVAWPAGEGVYYRRATDPYAGLQITWIGNLATNGATTTGQLFRRNRFFDPASGRFSQENPAGLAGGANLSGFGNGDPINGNLSTHVGPTGVIIAIYPDGDPNIYVHNHTRRSQLDACQRVGNTACGGTVIGQTTRWDQFAGFRNIFDSKPHKAGDARTFAQCFTESTAPVAEAGAEVLASVVLTTEAVSATALAAATRYAQNARDTYALIGALNRAVGPAAFSAGLPVTGAALSRVLAGAAASELAAASLARVATAGTWVIVGAGGLAASYLGTTAVACGVAPTSF